MQHEAVWILPPQGESEGPTFITRTAPITQRPITYLSIGLLSLFGTHARAKSSDMRLTGSEAAVGRRGSGPGASLFRICLRLLSEDGQSRCLRRLGVRAHEEAE